MKHIFNMSHPFKVHYAVIGFNAVDVIDLLMVRLSGKKGIGNQHVQGVTPTAFVRVQRNSVVAHPQPWFDQTAYSRSFTGSGTLNPSKARDGIEAFKSHDRFPFFAGQIGRWSKGVKAAVVFAALVVKTFYARVAQSASNRPVLIRGLNDLTDSALLSGWRIQSLLSSKGVKARATAKLAVAFSDIARRRNERLKAVLTDACYLVLSHDVNLTTRFANGQARSGVSASVRAACILPHFKYAEVV